MSLLRFHTLDVFTRSLFTGNPLAVVLGGDTLDTGQMQAIAREFKLSETVFVLPAESADALVRLRIFTPVEELPFAGHPIIGSACLMADKGLAPEGNEAAFAFEVGARQVPVRLLREPGEAVFAEITAPQAPQFGPPVSAQEAIADALGLDASALVDGTAGPSVVSSGIPILLVPLRAPEHLAGIDVDFRQLAPLLATHQAHSVYVYARGYEGDIRSRMLSPGIGEDPATGAAALALAARLSSEQADASEQQWTVRQGVEMGRASELVLRAERRDGALRLHLGGYAVGVMEGHLNVA